MNFVSLEVNKASTICVPVLDINWILDVDQSIVISVIIGSVYEKIAGMDTQDTVRFVGDNANELVVDIFDVSGI